MAKSDELVKYITQRVVTYIDKPKEERLQERLSRQRPKEPWKVRWFGMLPMAFGMWMDSWRADKKGPPSDFGRRLYEEEERNQ